MKNTAKSPATKMTRLFTVRWYVQRRPAVRRRNIPALRAWALKHNKALLRAAALKVKYATYFKRRAVRAFDESRLKYHKFVKRLRGDRY